MNRPAPRPTVTSSACPDRTPLAGIRTGRVLALCGVLLLAGCFPYREQIVPRIDGRLVRGDIPAAGVRIHVLPQMFKAGCQPSRYTTATDATGRFMIEGDRKLGMLVSMGDRIDTWGVCIEENGRLIEGFRESRIGWPPRHVDMHCDLDRVSSICDWKARDD